MRNGISKGAFGIDEAFQVISIFYGFYKQKLKLIYGRNLPPVNTISKNV